MKQLKPETKDQQDKPRQKLILSEKDCIKELYRKIS